jgi:predicted nucleotidyltransferase
MADTGKPVKVAPADAEAKHLWSELGRLASRVLPKGWTLVGGLMVQLHAFEAGASGVRATTDIDILGNARVRTDFEKIARALSDDGFKLDPPSPVDRISHRWRRGGLVVDLLAPDGLRENPPVVGGLSTVQIPGGTQALERTETIEVEIGDALVKLSRPTLLGAVLIKARAIMEHADPDAQRADLVLLLSLVDDPSQTAAELKGKERNWLRDCKTLLGLDDPVLMAAFPRTQVQRAQLAYRLLVAGRDG